MSQASDVELLMLDLINEERTSRGLEPLTINNNLNASSEDHSRSMLDNNSFSHRGVDGSSATERMVDAGYDLEGSWRTGENIGIQSLRGEPGIADDVEDVHISLMNSPGHRANILNPDFDEIGIGVELGDFTYDSGARLDSVMITQNFGRTDAETSDPAPVAPVADTAETVAVTAPAEDDLSEVVQTTTTTTGSTTDSSSSTVTTTAGPDGVDVEIDGDGNFTAGGTASNGEDTVTETDSDGSLAEDVPADDLPAPEPAQPPFDAATFFDQFFAEFDFGSGPATDDMQVVTTFEGSIATPDGTVTINDPEEFSTFFMDMVMMATVSCADLMDMG